MRAIQTFREGDRISQVLLCKSKQTMTAKNGKNYYSLVLQDKTGTLDGKVWDLNAGIDHFEAMDFICVDGEITSFNNNLQMNVRRVRKAQAGEYVESDFFPTSNKDIETMYKELLGYVAKIENPKMKALVESFFVKDEAFIKQFKQHSAAKSVHHGFIGGLLEHTLAVTKLCWCYCWLYPQLNKDLLLAAAMFHDIGKLREISDFPTNDYTDDGQLLGHIVIGCEMIGERIKTIPDFPAKTATELRHCILAHHGEFEYGSPKKPALMEAAALNFADNTDARMETFIEQVVGASSSEWLGFNRFVDSNVRKTTPLE
jgi:3'-5' exoribonuclease